ncbi:MAG: ATP-binding protein [Steroidobacteraceae bacterium]
MRFSLWPQSLFGRLIAAMVIGVLLAQAASVYLFAREREGFVLESSVREWSRRIAEVSVTLEQLPPAQRAATVARLKEQAANLARRRHSGAARPSSEALAAAQRPPALGPSQLPRRLVVRDQRSSVHLWSRIFIQLPLASGVEAALERQLRTDLGRGYDITVQPASLPEADVIPIPSPMFGVAKQRPTESYDVAVRLPDGSPLVFRVMRLSPGTPLPLGLLMNLILLVAVLVVALYVTARSITRPLSRLAGAAENLGRSVRQPKLEEEGARELRRAAHAFNTMQDRLHRYLDSRTRVLAAMSHDLKTPLTRLRLQVETQIEDPTLQERFSKELDEMESMVRGALALFRGLDDQEAPEPVDIDALLERVRGEFAELGQEVTVEGHSMAPFPGKPQALKRCVTNLIANAVKFGTRARILVRDGTLLKISVCDQGPGIPPEELERVFEPFYRLESSRNRDTGGTGLGLSIARDVAQTHGGTLVLLNRAEGGLEALLTLPRGR